MYQITNRTANSLRANPAAESEAVSHPEAVTAAGPGKLGKLWQEEHMDLRKGEHKSSRVIRTVLLHK